MGRSIFMAVFIAGVVAATAQQQIPNGDFEQWTTFPGSGSYKDYEEPSSGWTSGNGVIHVAAGANAVLEKATDRVSGEFAAKCITQRIFGQIASGSLYTGKFQLNLGNPALSAKRGIPFMDRPTAFVGSFKYLPQGSDSATMYAILSRWDGTKRVRIAEARSFLYQPTPGWTTFDLAFVYESGDQPDTISVVFASSAGGEFFRGDVGSTLYVDDVRLTYDPTSVNKLHDEDPTVVWSNATSTLYTDPSLSIQRIDVVSVEGACIASFVPASTAVPIAVPASGVYFIIVHDGSRMITKTISVMR